MADTEKKLEHNVKSLDEARDALDDIATDISDVSEYDLDEDLDEAISMVEQAMAELQGILDFLHSEQETTNE